MPKWFRSILVLFRNLSHEVSFICTEMVSLKEELGTITQTLKSHLPGPVAVDKALKMSKQEVIDTAAALNDKQLRAKRKTIWEYVLRKDRPIEKETHPLLGSLPLGFSSGIHQRLSVKS